ncbi:MAG: chemotaxis protein CheW [Pseudomonadota bacterium]
MQEIQTQSEASSGMLELLSFTLAGQDYAVDIMLVREIRNWSKPTPLPKTPDYVRGVINLRGTVLPILDLARRLELEGETNQDRAVYIVLNDGGRLFGITVDAVSDILTIPVEALQEPPAVGASTRDNCVKGLILDDERLIRVLATERLAQAGTNEGGANADTAAA